jgi:hypothetical protein
LFQLKTVQTIGSRCEKFLLKGCLGSSFGQGEGIAVNGISAV